ARRARQGHRLHRAERARASDRGVRGRTGGDRGRSQEPLHQGPHHDDPDPVRPDMSARPTVASGKRPDRISGPALLKIAIVKLSSLGDVIHALPVARALRRSRPGLHLTWIVEAREYALLNGHPDLDVVVPVDTRLWRRLIWRPTGARQVLGKVRRLKSRVRAARFDVAIDLQGLMKSGLLTAYTGAPLRIGFTADRCRERLNCLFTNRRVRPPARAVHVVDQYLALLGPLGIPPGPVEFHVPIPARATLRMDDFLG